MMTEEDFMDPDTQPGDSLALREEGAADAMTTDIVRIETPYRNPGKLDVTDQQVELLLSPVPVTEVAIRPDGIVYWPGAYVRLRLTRTFGPGGWALVKLREPWVDTQRSRVYFHGALFVRGVFVAEAIGGHDFHEENANDSWDDALESAKTNCLVRCTKDMSVGHELWEPDWTKAWKRDNAVEVWCHGVKNSKVSGKAKKMWRKRSDPPIDAYPWKEGDAAGDDDTQTKAATKPAQQAKPAAAQQQAAQQQATQSKTAARPWAPSTLRNFMGKKADKIMKDLGDVGAMKAEMDTDQWTLFGNRLEELWPMTMGPDLLPAAMAYLFNGPAWPLNEARVQTVMAWLSSEEPEVILAEARGVTKTLELTGAWSPS